MKALPVLSLAVATIPFISAAPAAKSFKWKDTKFIFSFGDSYTTTNFNLTGPQPNQANPLGNPVQFPGVGITSSDGPNYVGFLTTTYNESFIKTYNIAHGGATVDNDVVGNPKIPSIKQQIEKEFIPIYSKKPDSARWDAGNTLFTIWIGINDVNDIDKQQNSALMDRAFESYSSAVEQLWKAGARNFVFQNVPPIDRAPLTTRGGSEAEAKKKKLVEDWNNRVQKLTSDLKSKHSEVQVFFLDVNKVFTAVLDDPKSHQQTSGLKNTTSFCAAYGGLSNKPNAFDPKCGIPVNEYFWLNDLHPTFPIHHVVAESIVKLVNSS